MAEDSPEIVREAAESVAIQNVKVGAGGPSFWLNLAMSNAVNNQQTGFGIQQAVVIKGVESLLSTQPSEGAAESAMAQIISKLAQSTRPETGAGQELVMSELEEFNKFMNAMNEFNLAQFRQTLEFSKELGKMAEVKNDPDEIVRVLEKYLPAVDTNGSITGTG